MPLFRSLTPFGKLIATLFLLALGAVGGYLLLNTKVYQEKQPVRSGGTTDYKDMTFFISGESVTMKGGYAETETLMGSTSSPQVGSASKSIVRYFGNEAKGDLNGDGIVDLVFLITQEGGGTGTLFYLVGAIQHADNTYEGTHAVFIGDRIAPQTTEFRDGLIIVNYADRKPGEPFTTAPSEGKSLYLKYDPNQMDFGEVVQNFEGESAGF